VLCLYHKVARGNQKKENKMSNLECATCGVVSTFEIVKAKYDVVGSGKVVYSTEVKVCVDCLIECTDLRAHHRFEGLQWRLVSV
jgi:nicotinamide mononucleotide (NMN) deamidase PncC